MSDCTRCHNTNRMVRKSKISQTAISNNKFTIPLIITQFIYCYSPIILFKRISAIRNIIWNSILLASSITILGYLYHFFLFFRKNAFSSKSSSSFSLFLVYPHFLNTIFETIVYPIAIITNTITKTGNDIIISPITYPCLIYSMSFS